MGDVVQINQASSICRKVAVARALRATMARLEELEDEAERLHLQVEIRAPSWHEQVYSPWRVSVLEYVCGGPEPMAGDE